MSGNAKARNAKHKPKVGQKVIVHSERYIGDGTFNEYEVCRVGRKYFYVKIFSHEHQFHIDTWCEKTDYTCTLRAYENIEALNDEREKEEWSKLFCEVFAYALTRKQFTIAQYRNAARCFDLTLKGVAK